MDKQTNPVCVACGQPLMGFDPDDADEWQFWDYAYNAFPVCSEKCRNVTKDDVIQNLTVRGDI